MWIVQLLMDIIMFYVNHLKCLYASDLRSGLHLPLVHAKPFQDYKMGIICLHFLRIVGSVIFEWNSNLRSLFPLLWAIKVTIWSNSGAWYVILAFLVKSKILEEQGFLSNFFNLKENEHPWRSALLVAWCDWLQILLEVAHSRSCFLGVVRFFIGSLIVWKYQ